MDLKEVKPEDVSSAKVTEESHREDSHPAGDSAIMEEALATDDKKYLTAEQVLTIEKVLHELQLIDRDRKLLRLQIDIADDKLSLAQAEYKERTQSLKETKKRLSERISSLDSKVASVKESSKLALQEIVRFHGLEEDIQFKYHPETYEIIVDN